MASFFGHAVKLARSPAGKRLLAEAQKAARDPKNKERVEQVRQRISGGAADKTAVPSEQQEKG